MTYVGRHRKPWCPRLWDTAVTVSETVTTITTRATAVAATSTLLGIALWSGDLPDPPRVATVTEHDGPFYPDAILDTSQVEWGEPQVLWIGVPHGLQPLAGSTVGSGGTP